MLDWYGKYSHKALRMPELPVGVDDALVRFEAFVAARAVHRAERHVVGGNAERGILFIRDNH